MNSFQLSLSAAQLMARSRQMTGIDSVDADIQEALERLVHALNNEAQLNEAGARGMESRILTILCNRLCMQRDFDSYPEIDDEKIVRPHILTGAGRSGSTKMHKLLAGSGDFKFLRFWQQYNPSLRTGRRIEDPSERIREADEFTRWFDRQVPQAKLIHPYETFEPEEETFLFDHARFGINFNITHTTLPSYMQWYMGQDIVKQLQFIKQSLKYLQWQFHDHDDRPWVLKNPLYCGLEPVLEQVFPSAVLIATHRDPTRRVSSSAGLVTNFKKAYSDLDRTHEAGPGMLEFMAEAANQYLAGRDAHPGTKILDIGYGELTTNSQRVVEKIYTFADRPFKEQVQKAIARWEDENHQHKHGVYNYTLADYGITPEMVNEKFRPYVERFREYL